MALTEPVFKVDATGSVVPVPIDLSDETDKVYPTIYGTRIQGAGTSEKKVSYCLVGNLADQVTSAACFFRQMQALSRGFGCD